MIVFIISTQKCLIVGGDTIEYLEMSNNLSLGLKPESDKWMPLYSFFVFGFSKLFGLTLFGGARIFQLLLGVTFVFWYNYKFLNRNSTFLNIFLINSPFFCYSQFLYQSMALMADFTFLVITFLFLYYLYKYSTLGDCRNFICSLIFCLVSFMTKNNGLVNFVLLFLIVIMKNEQFYYLKLFCIFFSFLLYYYLWYGFNAKSDYLFGGINIQVIDRICVFNDQIQGLWDSIFFYFFNIGYPDFIKDNIKIVAFLTISLWLLASIYVLIKVCRRKFSFPLILLAFCVLYTVMLFGRQLLVGYNEINVRTMFHIYFLVCIIIINRLITLDFKLPFFVAVFTILLFGLFNMTKFVHRSNVYGIGKLSEDRFDKDKNKLLSKFIFLRENLKINNVYSNENKTLGLISGIHRYHELPSIWQFSGNNYLMDTVTFNLEKSRLIELGRKQKVLLVYFHFSKDKKRYDSNQIELVREFIAKLKYKYLENEFCTIGFP